MKLDIESMTEDARKCGIPDYMIGGLLRYVLHGVPPGNFLTAVMENDLLEALGRADDTNQQCLRAYGLFIYNYTPTGCHGSPEKVDAWLAQGGALGPLGIPPSLQRPATQP